MFSLNLGKYALGKNDCSSYTDLDIIQSLRWFEQETRDPARQLEDDGSLFEPSGPCDGSEIHWAWVEFLLMVAKVWENVACQLAQLPVFWTHQ